MKVGVLKDIKVGEYRVIATPAEVSMLVSSWHNARMYAVFCSLRVVEKKSQ